MIEGYLRRNLNDDISMHEVSTVNFIKWQFYPITGIGNILKIIKIPRTQILKKTQYAIRLALDFRITSKHTILNRKLKKDGKLLNNGFYFLFFMCNSLVLRLLCPFLRSFLGECVGENIYEIFLTVFDNVLGVDC